MRKASWFNRARTTFRVTPTTVVFVGFICGIITPFVAKQGGNWIFAGAILVSVTVAADHAYLGMIKRVDEISRRSRVFVPLAARLVEFAWLYGYWKLGAPAGVVVAAGGLSLMHEYLRSRGHIAGLRDIGIVTLGDRSIRAWTVLAGYGIAGVVALTPVAMSTNLAAGIVAIGATAWLLLAVLGFVQLAIVISAALRR